MVKILASLAILAQAISAQTPAQPLVIAPQQFFDNNGIPLALGTVATYVAGTSTPIATCRDSQCSSFNTTTIVLDAAGRANIFLAAGQGYKYVVSTSAAVVLYTQDGITAANTNNSLPVSGGTITGNLTVTGLTTLGNTIFTGSCTGTPCLWTSVGNTVSLVNSTQSVSPLVFENQGVSGDTSITLQSSSSQAGQLFTVKNNGGVSQGGIDASFNWLSNNFQGTAGQFSLNTTNSGTLSLSQTGRLNWLSGNTVVGATPVNGLAQNPTYSAIEVNNGIPTGVGGSLGNLVAANITTVGVVQSNVTGTSIGLQVFNGALTPFQVDGSGDVSANGRITAIGTTTGAAFAIGPAAAPVTIVDSSGNAFVNNLTVAGTCTGCGGGGGGGLPVSDTTIITRNAADPTKQMKFSNGAIATGTTATLIIPAITSGTIMTEENTETVSGTKTFSTQVFGTGGFTGLAFSSTASGSTGAIAFQVTNTNSCGSPPCFPIQIDGLGDISTTGEILALKYVQTDAFAAFKATGSTPGTIPNSGYSGLTYKGGTSCGLCFWAYDAQASAWSSINLAAVAAPGITAINGQTGPTISLNGTANQITATTTANTITLATPQPIALTSNVAFNSINIGCGAPGPTQYVVQSCAPTGTAIAFQINNLGGGTTPFIVNGQGDISANGRISMSGAVTGVAYMVNGISIIDASRNATFNNMTITGTCTGCGSGGGGITSINGQAGPAITVTGGASAAALTVTNGGNTVTLTTPQAISTVSSPTFANVSTPGQFNSSFTGAAFTTASGNFSVTGSSGQVSGIVFQANGGGGGFNVTADTAANSIQTVGGESICTTNGCASGNAITINGVVRATSTGYWIGPINTSTTGPASVISINGGSTGGQFYGNAIAGASTGFSCSGVANGYEAYSLTDQFIVICLSGTRYRAALTAF